MRNICKSKQDGWDVVRISNNLGVQISNPHGLIYCSGKTLAGLSGQTPFSPPHHWFSNHFWFYHLFPLAQQRLRNNSDNFNKLAFDDVFEIILGKNQFWWFNPLFIEHLFMKHKFMALPAWHDSTDVIWL